MEMRIALFYLGCHTKIQLKDETERFPEMMSYHQQNTNIMAQDDKIE